MHTAKNTFIFEKSGNISEKMWGEIDFDLLNIKIITYGNTCF